MTVISIQTGLPSGYNNPLGGPSIPPALTLLFPPQDCAVTVRITSGTTFNIGGSGTANQEWQLPADQELVVTLPANEKLYGIYNLSTSNTTPDYAYVYVLVTELVS